MTERPIIFSSPMVRAILDGRKTQTRRLVDLKRLRVKMLARVVSGPFFTPPVVAKNGKSYLAALNPQGAVSAKVDGSLLGVKPGEFDFSCPYATGETNLDGLNHWVIRPHGAFHLWVRETWGKLTGNGIRTVFRADDDPPRRNDGSRVEGMVWGSPIFMSRHMSRITLAVMSVRLEHLQDITDEDAADEGVFHGGLQTMYEGKGRDLFQRSWDALNGDKACWESNPWVWAIRFRRVKDEK